MGTPDGGNDLVGLCTFLLLIMLSIWSLFSELCLPFYLAAPLLILQLVGPVVIIVIVSSDRFFLPEWFTTICSFQCAWIAFVAMLALRRNHGVGLSKYWMSAMFIDVLGAPATGVEDEDLDPDLHGWNMLVSREESASESDIDEDWPPPAAHSAIQKGSKNARKNDGCKGRKCEGWTVED